MSAAAAPPVDAGAAPPAKKGKKKLIIILAAGLLVLSAAGGGATFYIKKKAAQAAAEAGEEDGLGADKPAKVDLKHPPTFVPLDPFVVNLADRDADRYAQIGITLELDDAKFADQLKAFMPAIRNGILMVLAHKTSAQLLARAGKEALAAEILREAARPMGIEVDAHESAEPAASPDKSGDTAQDADDEAQPKAKPRLLKPQAEHNPLRRVHFSNFIIQ